MNNYYETLVLLAKIAEKHTNNKYTITDYAFGFIPFKNGENKVKEIGDEFIQIAHWLLDEIAGR